MKKIYKYTFQIADRVRIPMAFGSEILSIQLQNDVPTIWALCDSDTSAISQRWFSVIGTGQPFNDFDKRHLATLQMKNGLVWHIFE